MSSLEIGRPRDISSSPADLTGLSEDSDMYSILSKEGELLSVISSTGYVVIMSCSAVDSIARDGSSNEGVASTVLATHQLKGEPRLTAVVAWTPSSSGLLIMEELIHSFLPYR